MIKLVVTIVNFLKSHGLVHRQFQQFLMELSEDYGDVIYHCEIRWLSRGACLERFFNLRLAIVEFLKEKGKEEPKLEDPKWIADLAFLVDLTAHLNALNKTLQGEKQLISDLMEKVDAFKKKLALWKEQLMTKNTAHFPTLSKVRENANFDEFVSVVEEIQAQFSKRFQDTASLTSVFELFSRPFAVSVESAPVHLQMELIDLHCNSGLKDNFFLRKNCPGILRRFSSGRVSPSPQ